ncbi:MAG: hypothetical protein ABMA00_22265, partial [Gemmatimonas sp.]
GNAWVAGRDEYVIFHNPALASTTGLPFGVSFGSYGNHAFSLATAAGWTVGPLNLGVGVHMVNLSTSPSKAYPYTPADMMGSGDADVSSFAAVVAANVTRKGFRFGVGVKYAHDVAPRDIGSNVVVPQRGAAILADIGVSRPVWIGLAGLSVQNIATPYTMGTRSVSVPSHVALGWTAVRQWGELDYGFATQVMARRHGWVSPAAGLDVGYSWIEGYSVNGRVGARRTETKDERPVTLGAAINADRLNVEYGLGFFVGNETVHRLTLRWR